MGNSLPCLCHTSLKDKVAVMKENGELMKFSEGVSVKQIVAAHQGYKIVRCGSDRMVLSDSSMLRSNRLYFLVPEDLELDDETYQRFWKAAETKGFTPLPNKTGNGNKRVDGSNNLITGQVMPGQVLLFDPSEMKMSPWRPRLQTIPEVKSPATPTTPITPKVL